MINFKSFCGQSKTGLDTEVNKWLKRNPDITVISYQQSILESKTEIGENKPIKSHQQSIRESRTKLEENRSLYPIFYFLSLFYKHPFSKDYQDIKAAIGGLEEVRQFVTKAKYDPEAERKIRSLGYSGLGELEVYYFHLADVTYKETPSLDRDLNSVFTGRVLRSLEKSRFIKLGQLQNLSLSGFKKLPGFGPKIVQKMREQIADNHLQEQFPNLF